MNESSTWQVFFEHMVEHSADSHAADIGLIMDRLEDLALPRSTVARLRHTLVNAVARAAHDSSPETGGRKLLVRVLVCDPGRAARPPGLGWGFFVVNHYVTGTPLLSSLEFYLHRGYSTAAS